MSKIKEWLGPFVTVDPKNMQLRVGRNASYLDSLRAGLFSLFCIPTTLWWVIAPELWTITKGLIGFLVGLVVWIFLQFFLVGAALIGRLEVSNDLGVESTKGGKAA